MAQPVRTFRIGGGRAYYEHDKYDFVQVPPPQAYFEPINWHRTALHELGHASGHSSRLNRDLRHIRLEEVCVRGACGGNERVPSVCASLGIVPTVRHADYIGSWLEVLREDNRAIVRAASAKPRRRRIGSSRFSDGLSETDSAIAADSDRVASVMVLDVTSLESAESGEADSGPESFASLALRPCDLKSKRAALVFVTGWRSERVSSAARRGETDMATTIQKITLSASRDIPFNKLVLSQANVRRVKAGVSIEELAERHRPAHAAARP